MRSRAEEPNCIDDGTIEIEFAYRNGEAVLKAKRDPSSTAC